MFDTATNDRHLPEDIGPEHDAFRVEGKTAVGRLLGALVENGSLFALYASSTRECFATSRVTCFDDRSIHFDLTHMLRPHDDSFRDDHIIVVADLDGVKVQFSVETPPAREARDSTRLVCTAPTIAYRIQRRDAYRITTMEQGTAHCVIRFGSHDEVSVPIRDLSAGGVGILWPAGRRPLRAGERFEHCRLEISADHVVPVSLIVQQVANEYGVGPRARRVGMRFAQLPSTVERRIQRLVHEFERARMRALRAVKPACS